MLFKINLRMFDGASSGAGDGDSSASGVTNSTAASANGNNLENVVYGKQPNDPNGVADAEDAKAKYDSYRKGEGKQFIDKDIETAIRRRFKDYNTLKESNTKMQNVMSALATRYGIDANDTDALSKLSRIISKTEM